MNLQIVAIIPARAGSKGIAAKNTRRIWGKPLIGWSLEAALSTESIQRVVVSTDGDEIAKIADTYGVNVVWRPAEISGDAASSESALLHALNHLRDTEGYDPDLVVFLQATSPIRQPNDIQNAIHTLLDEEADSLFSACPIQGFLWRKKGGETISLSYDYRSRQRRQDLPEDLVENGSIYVFKPWVLRKFGNRLGGRISVYPMHPLDSFQVDEDEDLELIEGLMPLRLAKVEVEHLQEIRLLVLDFDGVMTDNRVLVDETARESVLCDRSDGWGIARLKEAGVQVVVLSTEINPVVTARCQKLEITCFQAVNDKVATLKELARQHALHRKQIAFVGNDLNDLGCMRWVGLPIAVADAVEQIRRAAHVVTLRPGGRGAVREICDLIVCQKRGLTHGKAS